MVDWNRLKDQALDLSDKAKEKANEAKELRSKSKQETKTILSNTVMGRTKNTTVRKDVTGDFYLSKTYDENAERFTFENIEFGGSSIISNTTGEVNTQGRTGSSLVGGMLAGGAGAVIGSSRKKKSKVNTTTTQQETIGKGLLHLRSKDTNEIKSIKFQTTKSGLDNYIRFFQ